MSQASICNAQIKDYKFYQDSIFNICLIENDSNIVVNFIHQMNALDTAAITTNKHLLYRDIGFLYYKLYTLHQENPFLQTAILNHKKAIQYNPQYTLALNDLMVFQYFNKDFEACMRHYKSLKSITRPSKDLRHLYRLAKKKSHA